MPFMPGRTSSTVMMGVEAGCLGSADLLLMRVWAGPRLRNTRTVLATKKAFFIPVKTTCEHLENSKKTAEMACSCIYTNREVFKRAAQNVLSSVYEKV